MGMKQCFVCDFCGKSQCKMNRMIEGAAGGCICDECVWRCVEVLQSVAREKQAREERCPKQDQP